MQYTTGRAAVAGRQAGGRANKQTDRSDDAPLARGNPREHGLEAVRVVPSEAVASQPARFEPMHARASD